jgi:hypothetical protein
VDVGIACESDSEEPEEHVGMMQTPCNFGSPLPRQVGSVVFLKRIARWDFHEASRCAALKDGFLSAVLTVLSVDKLYHKILFLSSL